MSEMIDTIRHCLTGPAILRACGLLDDGSIRPEDMERGYPKPVILVVLRGMAESKINLIRVAATAHVKAQRGLRYYNIQFGEQLHSTIETESSIIPVTLIPVRFDPTTTRAKIGAAFKKGITR